MAKPELYHNKEYKEFHNNREVFMSSDRENNSSIKNSNDIRKKVNDIINSTSFIYQTMVNIVIGNEIIKKKIIGIRGNNVVTIDNEYIPLDNIHKRNKKPFWYS